MSNQRHGTSANTRPGGGLATLRSEGARVWLALVALIVLSLFIAPNTLTKSALLAMLPVAAILAVSAVGQSLTIQQGGIDFSVPGAMTLAAVVVVGQAKGSHSSLMPAIITALAAVLVGGLFSGLAITALRISPIIATLAVNALLIGAVFSYANAAPTSAPTNLSDFAVGKSAGIPNTVLIAAAFILIAIFVQTRTVIGRRFISIGASPTASRVIGLSVTRYLVGTYMVAALCYGVAGIMLAGYVVSPGVAVGNPYLLSSITTVVIGGTAFGGGRARLAGTAAAALFLSQLNSLLSALGAPSSTTLLVQSAAIAIAVGLGPAITALRRHWRPRSVARANS